MTIEKDSIQKYQDFIRKCRRGAEITNSKLTKKGRSLAAKKGWERYRERMKAGMT